MAAALRLNQYLAACGLGSRRQCDELIATGRVLVNAVPAALGMRITTADRVSLDGRPVTAAPRDAVWMLHKPAGVLSAARDARGRRTVVDLARAHGIATRIFPVGRLDLETTGLLLLTNDGHLAHRLMHPAHAVEKEYEAVVAAAPSPAAIERLCAGLLLDDGPTSPCRATIERRAEGITVRLVIHEGRKRQVRRMLAAVGHPVVHLHRVRVGALTLGELPAGELRPLTGRERAALADDSGRGA
jgi:pseudouridine synthase